MKHSFRLKIEKLALGGFGIGYAEGKAVFVPYTAIGDEIEAELTHERKDMAFAKATNYLQRGEGAIPSPCEAFGTATPCGGCDWLDIDYNTQLSYKTSLLRELLQPLAPEADIHDIQASPKQHHYRNKAFMPVGEDADGLYCGIYSRWSHTIIRHQSCHIHPQIFDQIATRCLEILSKTGTSAYNESTHRGTMRHIGFRCSQDEKRIMLVLVTRSGKLPFTQLLVKQLTEEFPALCGIVQNINRDHGNVILGDEEKLLFGEPYLTDALGDLRFRIHYRSFWQVNSATVELIIAHLRNLVSKEDFVIDAYAGIGSLGLSLANSVQKVLCIEENASAVNDGRANLILNSIANATFLRAKTEDALPNLLTETENDTQPNPSVIILDPPRSGVQSEALQALLSARIPRILYLSCSPMTLHRDLKILLADGVYRLEQIQPFDMFPQTWHVETLAVLSLNPIK